MEQTCLVHPNWNLFFGRNVESCTGYKKNTFNQEKSLLLSCLGLMMAFNVFFYIVLPNSVS